MMNMLTNHQVPVPAHPTFATYAISTQVYLDNVSREYITILTIDRMPVENTPFRDIVQSINSPPLSSYGSGYGGSLNVGRGGSSCSCVYALMSLSPHRVGCGGRYSVHMDTSEIPSLISFLGQCGYRVDAQVTQLMLGIGVPGNGSGNGIGSGNASRLVCYINIGQI